MQALARRVPELPDNLELQPEHPRRALPDELGHPCAPERDARPVGRRDGAGRLRVARPDRGPLAGQLDAGEARAGEEQLGVERRGVLGAPEDAGIGRDRAPSVVAAARRSWGEEPSRGGVDRGEFVREFFYG